VEGLAKLPKVNVHTKAEELSWINSSDRKDLFEWVKKHSKQNLLKTFMAIFFNYLLIGLSVYCFTLFNNFTSYIIAIAIIGARQHALLILMHDGAHWRLANNKKTNDIISNLFLSYPLFVSVENYRSSHLEHHKSLNTEFDPDYIRKRGQSDWRFPKSKNKILVLFLLDLLGYGLIEMMKKIMRFNVSAKDGKPKKNYIKLSFYISFFSLLLITHQLSNWVILWLIPALTLLPALLRLRSIAEHFGLSWSEELTSSRNTNTNFLENLLLSPHNVSQHLDHHLFPSVPFYNLRLLSKRLLLIQNYKKNAYYSDHYLSFTRNSVIGDISNESSI